MNWIGTKKINNFVFDELTDKQLETLKEFQAYLEDEEITHDPRYNEEYLIRFLKANDFKLAKTIKMFTAFLEWRKEIKADQAISLYRFPELPEFKLLYEHGYHKTDREGRPVWIDLICEADINAC